MANIIRWGIRDGMRLARTVGKYLRDPSQYTTLEFIEAAEKAASKNPDEWAIFYSLGDKYMEIGQYARALQTCKRCVELKPNDIRSVYALATAYNILTRADWTHIKAEAKLYAQILSQLSGAGLFEPDMSKTEVEELGMVVDTAAAQAMRWFERALQLKPDRESIVQINQDLQALYQRYPHLKT